MSQRNVRGFYFNPEHDRAQDWDFLAKWKPNVIRLMLPGNHTDPNSMDVNRIKRVYDTCPDALILLRCWEVDDRRDPDNPGGDAHAMMVQNPQAEANRQVEWWAGVFDRCIGVPSEQLMAGLNNETGPEKDDALYAYTEQALKRGTELDVRLGVFVFSVGRPSLPSEGYWDIRRFSALAPLIRTNNGAIILHEYMQPEGMYAVWTDDQGNERKDYTYLIGRNLRWPLPLDIPIIIGEWGIDGILYNRHPDPKYGNSGWRNFKADWPPSRYADEYVECVRVASNNVIGICPFISDWSDRKWQSFDMIDAYGELLARKDLCVKDAIPNPTQPATTHLPSVANGGQTEPVPQGDNWSRSREFVRRWEGDYQNNPLDVGNWTGCAVNKGENKGTKYGISACSYPDLDIPNLTMEQADAIYFEDYWQASGADKLPWPYCLLAFDTAVLHGVGTSKRWQAEVGDNPYAFAAKRLRVYTKLSNWSEFGAGWVNRTADLLIEASKP